MARAGARYAFEAPLKGSALARDHKADPVSEPFAIERVIPRVALADATVGDVFRHDFRVVAVPDDAKVSDVFSTGEVVVGVVPRTAPWEAPDPVKVVVVPDDATVRDVFPRDLGILDALPTDATISSIFREGSNITSSYPGEMKVGDAFAGEKVGDLISGDLKLRDVFGGRVRVLAFTPGRRTSPRQFSELDSLKALKTFKFED